MRKGKKFEQKYQWLYTLPSKYKVKSPAYLLDQITGRKREIDVLIKYKDEDGAERHIAVECRDRKNIEDTMWIEQLVTKRNDLGLDCIVAVTTSDFTEQAMKKAKYYGIILERAEVFNPQTIETVAQIGYCNLKFIFSILDDISILTKNTEIYGTDYLSKNLNIADKYKLCDFLNIDCFQSKIVSENNWANNIIFQLFENPQSNNSFNLELLNNGALDLKEVFRIDNITRVYIKFKFSPVKISIPITSALSIVDVDTNSSKNYVAAYENDDVTLTSRFINNTIDEQLHFEFNNKLRFIGYDRNVQGLYGDSNTKYNFNYDQDLNKLIGSVDCSKLYNDMNKK